MPGPRPKPTRLKELAGNPGHRPLNANEPKPEQGIPEMPRGLSTAARREFKYITGQLLTLGLMHKTDGKAIASYCDAFSMVEQAEKEIKKHGLIFVSLYPNAEGDIVAGDIKPNPAVNMKFKAMLVMHKFLIEFGLTPASRSRLKIEAPKAADPMEELLRRKSAPAAIKESAPNYFDIGKKETGTPDLVAANIPDAATNFDA